MIFAGLNLSVLLGIASAMAALVVGMYILKLRRRAVSVPFSPIWKRVLKDKQATHLFSQLKRLLSLLLQLILVALLLLALGDPRLANTWIEGRNIVVLVDVSASMKAEDVPPTRVGFAKDRLSRLIDGLSGTDRMLIAELGVSPRPLTAMTDDIAALKDGVKLIRTKDTDADLERGLSFALDALRGLSKPEILLLSDGALKGSARAAARLKLSNTKLSYVPVGSEKDNIAITAFSVRRYPLDKSRYEVLLEVTNMISAPVEVELTLIGDGEIVDVTSLRLDANERLPRFYQDLTGASRTLEAKISLKNGIDHLKTDDRAFALMPERRRVRVLLVSPGNTYLEAALLLDEYLEVTLWKPNDPLPLNSYDVTILDGVTAELRPEHGARLYLNPPNEGSPVRRRSKREIRDFGFDTWDKKSPFLRWIAPGNIQVAKGYALRPAKGDKIVGASELGPILVSGEREGIQFLAVGFDPRDSDFVLRVGWPLFLLNAINTFAEEDTSYLSSYTTGSVWRIPVPEGATLLQLQTPDGSLQPVPVKDGYAVTFGETVGFYELRGAEGEIINAFAANMNNETESRIEPVTALPLGSAQVSAPTGFDSGVRREIWLYLLFLVVALSTIEWLTYHRRVTI